MERLQTFMDFIRSNPRWNIFVIAITTLAISVDIFYQSNGAGTLDWNDWLFWAKQNYEKIISSQNLFTMVISPVQGLFGLSYPLNPFFNPLWLIAVLIDETTTAHRLTTAIIFALFASMMTTILFSKVENLWVRLLVLFLTLNIFFQDFLPFAHLVLYPKTTFSYFRLMPPQNLLLVEALILFYFATKPGLNKANILIAVVISVIGIISDPFYFFLYFTPIVLVLGFYYLLNIKNRWKESLYYLIIIFALFILGTIEYPLLLQQNIARTVFNDSLFHSIKAVNTSSFVFQSPQNIIYSVVILIGLGYLAAKKKDMLAISILGIKIIFIVLGIIYLTESINFNFMPPLHVFEVSLIPLYFIFGAKGIEAMLNDINFSWSIRQFFGFLVLMLALGFSILKIAHAFTAENRARDVINPYPPPTQLVIDEQLQKKMRGSISFAIGTDGSEFNKINGLPSRFGIENRLFFQNNEGNYFFQRYGRTTSLISYWLNGQRTLEENNHLTNPFYVYFFRSLFMRDNDYYGTNGNYFTRPQVHLYPMLGVQYLFSDQLALFDNTDKIVLEDDRFFLYTVDDFNFGQYSPTQFHYVSDAEKAVQIMKQTNFDATNFAIAHDKDKHFLSNYELVPSPNGEIDYTANEVIFEGTSSGTSLNVLPILFSNCLVAEGGYRLVRVNLILTGIVFEGEVKTKLDFKGPPFRNKCLSKDIAEIDQFDLRRKYFPYPETYDRTTKNLLRDYVIGLIDSFGLYNPLVAIGWNLDEWEKWKAK